MCFLIKLKLMCSSDSMSYLNHLLRPVNPTWCPLASSLCCRQHVVQKIHALWSSEYIWWPCTMTCSILGNHLQDMLLSHLVNYLLHQARDVWDIMGHHAPYHKDQLIYERISFYHNISKDWYSSSHGPSPTMAHQCHIINLLLALVQGHPSFWLFFIIKQLTMDMPGPGRIGILIGFLDGVDKHGSRC